MTVLTATPTPPAPSQSLASSHDDPLTPRPDGRRIALVAVVWLLVFVAEAALVLYGLGPAFQQRDQNRQLRNYRLAISRSANESSGLRGVEVAKTSPAIGAAVAILEIGRLSVQEVVLEGVAPALTRTGPGHVPGSAGPGQSGNAVIVGRAHAFGRPFANLGRLRRGDPIVITTTQGKSLYRVESVKPRRVPNNDVYGPSSDDRLTLVTSASAAPWNGDEALVVVARMETVPFAPTPQGGRSSAVTGGGGDDGALTSVAFALLLYTIVMGAGIFLYWRYRAATAYLLMIAPATVVAIIAAETLSRLFPAWM